IGEAIDRVVGHANASADVRRDAMPRVEIVVAVGKEQPLGLTAMVLVGTPQVVITIEDIAADVAFVEGRIAIKSTEGRLAAVLTGQIKAHVVTVLIANTNLKGRHSIEVALIQPLEKCHVIKQSMLKPLESLVGHSDVATQVPPSPE